MGAVNFSIDINLVLTLKRHLPLEVFVETGTFQGDTVDLVKDRFNEIHSVELSPECYQVACRRFQGQGHIDLMCGNSAEALPKWIPMLDGKSVLYFMDAHWCSASHTAGVATQCPLLKEIEALGTLGQRLW